VYVLVAQTYTYTPLPCVLVTQTHLLSRARLLLLLLCPGYPDTSLPFPRLSLLARALSRFRPDTIHAMARGRKKTRRRHKICRHSPSCNKRLAYSSRLRHYKFADPNRMLPSISSSPQPSNADETSSVDPASTDSPGHVIPDQAVEVGEDANTDRKSLAATLWILTNAITMNLQIHQPRETVNRQPRKTMNHRILTTHPGLGLAVPSLAVPGLVPGLIMTTGDSKICTGIWRLSWKWKMSEKYGDLVRIPFIHHKPELTNVIERE
jgi:hypothetical protein